MLLKSSSMKENGVEVQSIWLDALVAMRDDRDLDEPTLDTEKRIKFYERNIEWYTYLDEYEKLVIRMTTRRVVIDNAVCPTITLVKVDGARRGGILLDVVQILVYQSLSIKKAYVSSDGQWCMHVFYATDLNGNKLTDESVISFIEHVNFT
ncbi:hypothetical protein V6N12_026120 [Hibiscus sabdariffa]|uniref:ACT domain-containing protein ACR n=1 Tax=Hibiscus sabdariffa TaxID=183260 RepID=A0ABR2DSG1_9ROSI